MEFVLESNLDQKSIICGGFLDFDQKFSQISILKTQESIFSGKFVGIIQTYFKISIRSVQNAILSGKFLCGVENSSKINKKKRISSCRARGTVEIEFPNQ